MTVTPSNLTTRPNINSLLSTFFLQDENRDLRYHGEKEKIKRHGKGKRYLWARKAYTAHVSNRRTGELVERGWKEDDPACSRSVIIIGSCLPWRHVYLEF